MIKKINKIENIGFFQVLANKLNLIYGENGSGESTFSTIIKSLSINNPELVSKK